MLHMLKSTSKISLINRELLQCTQRFLPRQKGVKSLAQGQTKCPTQSFHSLQVYFRKIAFEREISPKYSGGFGHKKHECLKPPDHYSDISATSAIFRKYLKRKGSAKPISQLSFKYFVNLRLISKLFSKER